MKKQIFAALFVASSAIALLNPGSPVKLVNTKTGYVVVEFQAGRVLFYDRFLEAEMKGSGILIPPSLLNEFDGKETILYGDPLFEKAFIEVYYPLNIPSQTYKWQN